MKFNYKARTAEGKDQTGTIEASSREAAALLLQKYNIFIISLEEEKTPRTLFTNIEFNTKVSAKDLSIFSRQLAVMLQSRVPVVQSLSSLAAQTAKPNFKKTLLGVSHLVEEGVSFAEAFAHYPKVFDNFYVSLVRSGEISGKISETLYYISDHLESEADITSQVRQAMIYPAFTLSILFVVVNIIIVFLLPKIQDLINQSSSSPDSFTLFMLGFYKFLGSYWWVMMSCLVAAVIGLIFYFRTAAGKKMYDTLSLKIPILGDIFRKVFLTRFCGNISTLMSAGISINKALEITSDTVNNTVYKDLINKVGRQVSEGQKISLTLAQYPEFFPSFVVQMIRVGEQTGKLDKTLNEVVAFYQKEIKRAIDLFLTLLEPMLIIFLGLVVGFLAISVFAPLYTSLGNI